MLRHRKLYAVTVSAICANLGFTPTALASDRGAANALWNDSASAGDFALWISKDPQNCGVGHRVGLPFLYVHPGGPHSQYTSGELAMQQIGHCAMFKGTQAAPAFARCADGTIRYSYDPSSNEYSGAYNVTLNDGTTTTGSFRAAYCKPSAP